MKICRGTCSAVSLLSRCLEEGSFHEVETGNFFVSDQSAAGCRHHCQIFFFSLGSNFSLFPVIYFKAHEIRGVDSYLVVARV